MYEQFINYITAVGKISEYACSQQDQAHVPVLYSGFPPLPTSPGKWHILQFSFFAES